MLDGLQTEINTYPTLVGASNKIKMQTINEAPAVTPAWIVMTEELKVPKGDMLALLSSASQVKLYDWITAASTAEAKGFNLFYTAHERFKVTDSVFRGTITLLHDPLALITESEKNAILRLGERLKTRAEELFGRPIVEGDFA